VNATPERSRQAGTESFFRIIALCWARPRLLLIELTWRWLSGGFLLVLTGGATHKIAALTGSAIEATGLFNVTIESAIADPARASVAIADAFAILRPAVMHVALGLAPLALFVWAASFAFGRSALLRLYDRSLPSRPWLLAVCEAARLAAQAAVFTFWYAALQWAARYALGPAADVPGPQTEPNLVLYCALVICITIGLFALWSLISWSLVAAPLIALLERTSFARGFVRSLRAGRVRGKFVEVNIAMSIIKVGLVVLAMVLSATPLPFESVMQGASLTAWWVFVTLLYFAASDFFKIARLFAFLEFWREQAVGHEPPRTPLSSDMSLQSS